MGHLKMRRKFKDIKTTPLTILPLGIHPFSEVWKLQQQLQRRLIDIAVAETRVEEMAQSDGSEAPTAYSTATASSNPTTAPPTTASDTLIVCSHPPVITIGRSGSIDNLLISAEQLRAEGIELFEIERGGDITYHGPEQVILYPIINLAIKRRDVGWYMRTLEEVVIKSLADFGVIGTRIEGKTGVWIVDKSGEAPRKISSIGVRLSRWCSMHGVAVNILPCVQQFKFIHPCGMPGTVITSVFEEQKKLSYSNSMVEDLEAQSDISPREGLLKNFEASLIQHFVKEFGYHY